MGRRKICWKTRFWGPFLHLAPPYSRKVDILMARDLKFWTFGTFRKHSLPVTDFKRLENLVFATVTCDTTLPTQKTSYQFRRERTVGQNSSYVLDCSLNSKLQNICDKTSTSRYLGLVNLLLFDLASYFLWATVLQFQTQKWHQSGALRLQFVDKNTARVVCWRRRLCSDPEFCKANFVCARCRSVVFDPGRQASRCTLPTRFCSCTENKLLESVKQFQEPRKNVSGKQ